MAQLAKCMYCKNPTAQVVGVAQHSYFTIKQMLCGRCKKAWNDFEGDVIVPAREEPSKELIKV